MAQRPVFSTAKLPPYVIEHTVDFKFHSGFSISQKQKSIHSLHAAYKNITGETKILEISSKSEDSLGVSLSAFNLYFKTKYNRTIPVENAFQSSKVFENGGPFEDIRDKTPLEAKRDHRLKNSGDLINFNFYGNIFPLIPKTYFYDWLYINTLIQNQDMHDEIIKYNAFTDIEFNPKKSLNCQARSLAIFVSLYRDNKIGKDPLSKEEYFNMIYGQKTESTLMQEDNYLFKM